MHTLDEYGNISHYDVLFTNKVVKNIPVENLEVLVMKEHEHYINDDKNKEVFQEGSMKQARKNVGASTCWDGYKAKGTKKKGGKVVPNCVKEEDIEEGKDGLWDNIHQKRKRMKAGSGEKKAKPGDKDYPKTLNVENYGAMRNPEKHAEKPDSELSFEQRRKKRMNDPKRGINSPAFKEFMRKQGM